MGSCCTPNYNYENGKVKVSDYSSDVQPTWCSGCGDYAIWSAMKRALAELEIAPHEVLLCFDIGCNGNMSDKIAGYRLHSLHGRVLPLAAGAKIANPNVKVIAFAGDGATYSEGLSHFINSIKANYPITLIVHNNGDYGLTTGQASATTQQGAVRNSSPDGPTWSTLNPIELALTSSPSFIARGFSGNINQLVEIFKQAIMFQEKGFAYVDILQSCPTYNKENTHTWYQERVYKVEDMKGYKADNIDDARKVSADLKDKIATGVLYRDDKSIDFLRRLKSRKEIKTSLVEEVKNYSVEKFLNDYR